MSIQRKSLGRGLSSVISGGVKKTITRGGAQISAVPVQAGKPSLESERKITDVRIASHGLFSEILTEKIVPSPYQARRVFDDAEIRSLADSISSEGLLQPLLVRQLKDGTYELLAGERRLRACRVLGLKRVVACVQSASDASAAAKGLIENLQRSDLNPIEEARGISNLMENFHLTQDAVSQRLGKPRSSVANSLRLLKLPDEVQGYISKGLISLGHAKIILGVEDPVQQTILARRVIENGLNVRNTEEVLKRMKNDSARKTPGTHASSAAQTAVIRDIQNKISTRLNAGVELKHTPKHGKIVIEYFGNDDLQRILEIIGVKI